MNRSAGHSTRAGGRRRHGHGMGRRGIGRLAIVGLSLAGLLILGGSGALAAAPLTVPMPAPLPPIRVLTLLVGLHLIGLCFGLGGATMLDFWILRWMRWGSLPAEIARIFLFVSKVVTVGLVLLWLSGLGFLAVYAVESPEKFGNPKLWAKITVVLVLTINGLLIHALVLPGVLRDIRRPMLDGVSGVRTGIFLVSGAVSGVSWYTAFALGLMRELNGGVPTALLLALWLSAVMAASLAAYFYWLHLREWTVRQVARPGPAPDSTAAGDPPPAKEPGVMARPVIRIVAPAPPVSEPKPSPTGPAAPVLEPAAPVSEPAAPVSEPATETAALASTPAAPATEPAAEAGTVSAGPAPALAEPAARNPAGPARIPADRILALTPAASRARPSRRA